MFARNDSTLPTQDGATPLSVASQEGHEEVVRILLESGAQELPDKVRLSD